jgi:MFS transporter, DHA1 family, multidrug resistance protein
MGHSAAQVCRSGLIHGGEANSVSFFTFAVYAGSSIYSPASPYVMEQFNVNHAEGALGLALYVLGYGTGSLLFSPLSEIPAIGRNPPYAISGSLFVILCIPTGLVENYAGLMILRFLLGFMGSPLLATAGASLTDIWAPAFMPFAIAIWSFTASSAPALGPTLSAYAIPVLGWHWHSWILMMLSGPVILCVLLFLPETSPQTILYYRVKRMKAEGKNVTSEAEQKQKDLSVGQLFWDAIIKPWEMNIKDPALLFTTVYLGLVYGIFYSFFEALPLVYPVYYGFTAENTALIFLAVIIGCGVGFGVHVTYLKKVVFPRMMAGTFGELENHLIAGVLAGPLISIGLFIFAWTSRPSVHWIVPTIGLLLIITGIYAMAQTILMYIPNIYPRYAASIFAANSLARSLFAFAAILYSTPMLERLGIDGGVSLCAGLMVVCNVLMFLLYKFGKKLRERSSFAQ